MSISTDSGRTEPTRRFRIVLNGEVRSIWEDWFDGADFQFQQGNTVLTGTLADQSHLHGLLRKIHDLHLTLKSVETF